MKFASRVLQLQNDGADPLWLHKVGTSLLYGAAKSAEEGLGSGMSPQARGATALWHDKESLAKALSPLIDVLSDEAQHLDAATRIFSTPSANLNFPKHVNIRATISDAVIEHFQKCTTLEALHRSGRITRQELLASAESLHEPLNRYGINGVPRMLEAWKLAGRDLVAELRANRSTFTPKHIAGLENVYNRTATRAEHFETELARFSGRRGVSLEQALEQATMAALGRDYADATHAKELFLVRHIESEVILGSKGAVLIHSLHPNYERAKAAAIRGRATSFSFVNPALAANPTNDFVAALDAAALKGADVSGIVAEVKSLGSAPHAPTLTAPAKPNSTALIEHSSHSRPVSEATSPKGHAETPRTTSGAHTGTRFAVAGIAGMAVLDGLTNLREPDGQDKGQGKIRFGRVVEVGLGAAALMAAWACKDATIGRLLPKMGR